MSLAKRCRHTKKTTNMKTKTHLLFTFLFASQIVFSQTYPTFGSEIKVTINGLTSDAMEPFISPDGNTLFYNSLNSADTTNLYYATKINDSTFNYVGLVGGTLDTSSNHLDAVPSIDSLSNYYWTSLRDFPSSPETIRRGIYSAGSVTNINKVYGTFNIFIPGWLVFDAAINFKGDKLYYSNAYFNNCAFGAPCIAKLGVAQKLNDSTFSKLTNSDLIFSNVNDTSYIIYAPQVTKDGLELYYTRLFHGGTNTEICVSVRDSIDGVFSLPSIIHSMTGFTPEAATPTTDKQKIYYHQRNSIGVFEMKLRYRTGTTSVNKNELNKKITIFPNPSHSLIEVNLPIKNQEFSIEIYSLEGQKILSTSKNTIINISDFAKGLYFLTLTQDNKKWETKIVIE
jgi:hypothetical protein